MRLLNFGLTAAASAALFAAFTLGPARAETPVPKEAKDLSAANNRFGVEMLRKLHKPGENTFLSPTSIGMALQMTSRGAKGDTLAEMNKTMHVGELEVGEANRKLMAALSGRDDVKLNIANAIWADPARITLDKDFSAKVSDEFKAEIKGISFSDPKAKDEINGWVSDRTEKKIPELLEEAPEGAVCILVNAIYFKGNWTSKFDKDKTVKADFNGADGKKQRIEMMQSPAKVEWKYTDDEDVQVVALPYGPAGDPKKPGTGPKVHMWLIVPKEGKSLDSVVTGLTGAKLAAWQESAYEQPGTIHLPRFKMKFKKELGNDLKALGMAKAFNSREADFSGFEVGGARGKLFIDQVIHEAVIEVDEEGTEAAAATAVVMSRGSAPRPFTVRCDKPFLLAITDDRTGSIMFIGTVYKPDAR